MIRLQIQKYQSFVFFTESIIINTFHISICIGIIDTGDYVLFVSIKRNRDKMLKWPYFISSS